MSSRLLISREYGLIYSWPPVLYIFNLIRFSSQSRPIVAVHPQDELSLSSAACVPITVFKIASPGYIGVSDVFISGASLLHCHALRGLVDGIRRPGETTFLTSLGILRHIFFPKCLDSIRLLCLAPYVSKFSTVRSASDISIGISPPSESS